MVGWMDLTTRERNERTEGARRRYAQNYYSHSLARDRERNMIDAEASCKLRNPMHTIYGPFRFPMHTYLEGSFCSNAGWM